MHLNLAHLAYAIAVARTGSITRASAEKGVSQSAISAAIKGLEERFGCTIFVRNRAKGLSMTPSGRQFVRRAEKLLSDAGEFEIEAQGLGKRILGEVQIACYQVISPYVLPPVMEELAAVHPGLQVRLHEGSLVDVVNTVKQGVADVALTYDMFDDNTVELETLAPVQPHVMLADTHPLAAREVVSLADLAAYPFILLDIPGVREYYFRLFRQHGVEPRVNFRGRSLELVRSLVGLGLGFSFALLPIATQRSYSGGVIVRRPLAHPVEQANLCLVSAKGGPLPRRAEAFAAICRTAIVAAMSRDMDAIFVDPPRSPAKPAIPAKPTIGSRRA